MLVAIEGIDGAGKATLANLVVRELRDAGIEGSLISFPRYKRSFTSGTIASLLATPNAIESMHPKTVAAIFATERLESIRELQTWAESPGWLVIDRYTFSNVAYQGARLPSDAQRQAFEEWIFNLEFEVYGLPRPDLTVFLDLDHDEAVQRRATRETTGGRVEDDAYETDHLLLDFARRSYASMCDRNVESKWLRMPSEGDPRTLAQNLVRDGLTSSM